MGKSSIKATLLRKTLITSSLLGLVVLFFVMNYLVFIPRQQKSYNKKIFRILHEQTENLDTIINAYSASYNLSIKNEAGADDPVFWDTHDFADSSQHKFIKKIKNSFKGNNIFASQKARQSAVSVEFVKDSVVFRNTSNKKIFKSITIGDILEPIQATHENVFDYIILIKRGESKETREDKLLYKSPNLDVDDYKLNIDSLYKKNSSPFAIVRDTIIEGATYKFFLLPFRFRNNPLCFGAFIEEHKYKSNLTGSSYPVILVIGSLLIIIIISLPILKIYFLGRRENITIADIRLLMAAFLAGPALFILALSTVYTYYHINNRTDFFLDRIDKKVKKSFYKELSSAVKQLKSYDSLLDDPGNSKAYAYYDSVYSSKNKKADSFNRVTHNIRSVANKNPLSSKDIFFYPSTYKILGGVSWTNADGYNLAKWAFLDTQLNYFNLKERQYFQDIRDNKYNIIETANKTMDTLSIQPTMSWSTGAYTINIAIPSKQIFPKGSLKQNSAIAISLSANMYSVCYPVLPKGFNFCIVNDKGDMLFHSQTSRSLHENLFEESENNSEVRKAISHKDRVLISGITLYDHQVKMLITPMEGLQYYMVTYVNVREQNIFVFHIAAFALFSSATLLIVLLFFLLSYHLSSQKLSSTFFTIHQSDWMAPSQFKNNYYKTLILFQLLLLSVLSVLFLFILAYQYAQLHPYIIKCAILLPFFSTVGYFIIRKKSELDISPMETNANETVLKNDGNKKNRSGIIQFLTTNSRILSWYFLFVLLFFLFNIVLYSNPVKSQLKIGFDIGIVIMAACIPFLAAFVCYLRPPTKTLSPNPGHLVNYNTAIFLSIILISILPTFGFFYYGFKKEELLWVKARQVFLAEGIERKAASVNHDNMRRKIIIAPDIFTKEDSIYFHNLVYASDAGIYTGNNNLKDTVFSQIKDDGNNTDLYQLVTKFLFLPPDHTDFFNNTNYYHWNYSTKFITLLYLNTAAGKSKNNAIELSIPWPRNEMLEQLVKNPIGWLTLISLAFFLIIHYKLIIPLVRRIFMVGYFDLEITDGDKQWINNIFQTIPINAEDTKFYDANDKITYDYITNKEDEQTNNGHHGAEAILKIQNQLLPAYDIIWNKCSPVEKFILYDFATDGFTNYKNADILFNLYHRGLIRKDPETGRLIIMSYSFRNYLIAKAGTDEIQELNQASGSAGVWKNLKTIFIVLLFVVIIYIFIAQQEITNKLLVIIPGIVAILPQVLKLFDKNFLGTKTDAEK